eukprot:scaffold19787_cov127-Skeletonema_dohrnii-CCMP3373.AAC.5
MTSANQIRLRTEPTSDPLHLLKRLLHVNHSVADDFLKTRGPYVNRSGPYLGDSNDFKRAQKALNPSCHLANQARPTFAHLYRGGSWMRVTVRNKTDAPQIPS